jgi:hypothetical protein
MADDGILENAFAGARLTDNEAKSALLAVDLEDVEVALLVLQERGVVVNCEGLLAEAKIASNHGGGCLCFRLW